MRRGSLVMDPYPPLQKVDPHPERGSSGPTVHRQQRPSGAVAAVCLLALLWLVAKEVNFADRALYRLGSNAESL